jgi:hypothetical protein
MSPVYFALLNLTQLSAQSLDWYFQLQGTLHQSRCPHLACFDQNTLNSQYVDFFILICLSAKNIEHTGTNDTWKIWPNHEICYGLLRFPYHGIFGTIFTWVTWVKKWRWKSSANELRVLYTSMQNFLLHSTLSFSWDCTMLSLLNAVTIVVVLSRASIVLAVKNGYD